MTSTGEGILIVEDDASTLELERRTLERSGHRVHAVGLVRDALEALGREGFQAVLLDYRLPDGEAWPVFEAAQQMVPPIPVIFVTGMGDERIAAEMIHRGVADYLIKGPEFWDRLPAALERVLRLDRAERSNARLAAIVEATDDAILSIDMSAVVLSWNRGAERLYGYSREEMEGHAGGVIVPRGLGREVEGVLERVHRGEVIRNFETKRLRKDGSLVDVSTTVSPLRDPAGNVIGATFVTRDITDRKRAERRLAVQHSVTRILAESASLLAAGPELLRAICEGLGWEMGVLWRVQADEGSVGCAELWHAAGPALEDVATATRLLTRRVTDGAVGRAVERRGVAWSVVTAQPGALRAEAAAAAGLKTAVAFPLFVQESLVGAFEFLARQAEPPDEELLRMLADLASQIGQLAERWHAVEALRHSKRWLNLALESARMGAWDLDLVTGSMSRSPNHDQVFGYETPLLRWSLEVFLSHVLPEDRDAVKAGFERALETGEFREECRIRWLDGSVHWIAEQGRVLRDEHGKPVRKVGVVTEITDLKAAAEAVRESEERHRALFDASPLPMWLYDRESLRILAVNDAAVRHYGYSRDEFLSMSLEDIRPTEDIPKLHADHVQEAPQYHSAGIWRHVKKNGTVIEVDVHVTDVAIGGRVLRLALLHDVTAQRRLEEQLRQAQKMDAVGRLAGGVAHDFNNLLTVINGYTELLLEHFPEDPEKRARTLGEIAKAGERAATLTRQLLAFSRKQVVAPRTVDLNKIVSGVESLLHRMIGEDVELVGSLAPRLWSVRADPGQIEQVIMNLAVNARDAMPRGGRLAIETRNVELDESYVREHVYVEPGPYVLLSVSDTGTGMDQETMRHIFEPFFTTKEQGKGTGLGLATVYGIVQQFGGHVWVYSEPEKGTSVKVYLPRVKKGVSSHPSMAQLPIPKPGTETVLLVEDEESIRRFAAEVLRASGYTVLEAPLPSSAIAMAESESGPIHVLLTDIVMPEMSGPDLAEAIKERHPATRPIFMSGYSNDAAVNQRLLEAGTAFLEKPFRPADLTRKVREVLEGKAG